MQAEVVEAAVVVMVMMAEVVVARVALQLQVALERLGVMGLLWRR